LRVVARKLLYLLPGVGVSRSLKIEVMAHPPYGSAQKERTRFALYCAAVILLRFLFQGAKNIYAKRKGVERFAGR